MTINLPLDIFLTRQEEFQILPLCIDTEPALRPLQYQSHIHRNIKPNFLIWVVMHVNALTDIPAISSYCSIELRTFPL